MASRGRKPTPVALKIVKGNPGKRPLPDQEIEVRESKLKPPVELEGRKAELWDRFIESAWWLNEHDSAKAYMWVCLESEFENSPMDMTASRIGQLRSLGSELGFDPSARSRMPSGGSVADPSDKYFD